MINLPNKKNKILIASDHAGFNLKNDIKIYLANKYIVEDLGCFTNEKTNYAVYGLKMGKKISENLDTFGVAICGSGIGISIAANRYKHVRAARVFDKNDAKLSRKHNNANVIALGSRCLNKNQAIEIIEAFLKEPFEGGRHKKRVETLDQLL